MTLSIGTTAAQLQAYRGGEESIQVAKADGKTSPGEWLAVGVGTTVGGVVGAGIGAFAAMGLAMGGTSVVKSNAAFVGMAALGAVAVGLGTYGLTRVLD